MTSDIDAEIQLKRHMLEYLTNDVPKQAANLPEKAWWTPTSAMTMSSLVLLFGLITIALASWLIKSGKTSDNILRIYGTIMIIVISVFLVVAGYNNNQIAPVTGLLGTIAGYLLGKGAQNDSGKP